MSFFPLKDIASKELARESLDKKKIGEIEAIITAQRSGITNGVFQFPTVEGEGEDLLRAEILTQDDFIELDFSAFGESRVNYNPVANVYQTRSGPSGYTGNLWNLDVQNQTFTESTTPANANDVPFSYNIVEYNRKLVKVELTDGSRTTLSSSAGFVLGIRDIAEGSDGNYYLGNDSKKIQVFDGVDGSVPTTIKTLDSEEGEVVSVDVGFDGNIYFTTLGINGSDWNHGVYKYEIGSGLSKVFDQTESNKGYLNAIVASDGTIYMISSSASGHSLEVVETPNTTKTLHTIQASKVSNAAINGASGAIDGDGSLSITMALTVHDGGTIKVVKQHIAPITGSASITVDEDSSGSADLSSLTSDPSHIKSFVSSTNASLGVASISGNTLTFTPAANAHGTATITIAIAIAETAGGATSEVTFDVTVNPVNDAPTIAVIGDITVNEDAADMTINTDIADVDGDTPTVSVSSSNVNVTATLDNDNNIILSFAEDFNTEGSGPVTITVTADDGQATNNIARRTFEVRVNAVDDLVNSDPTIADIGNVTVDEDVADMTISTDIADVDDDTPTVSVSSSNVNVTATLDGDNNIILSLAEDFNTTGSDPVTITVTADDGNGGVARRTFDVTVNAVDDFVNSDPTLTSGVSLDATQGQAFAYTITGSDVDGDGLTYSVSGLPTWLSFDGGNQVTGTPTDAHVGDHTFTVTISDGTTSVDVEVTVNVEAVVAGNSDPTLTSDINLDATQGQAFAYTITGSDVDGDDLTYSVSGLPTWLSFDGGNQVTGTPTDAHVGDHTFTVTISDGTTSVDVEVTVNVEAVAVGNNAPIIADMEDVTFNEDEVVSTVVGVNISDVDGDTPTVSVSSSNVNVTAEFNNNNNIILGFAENFNTESSGPVTITVTADDGNGGVARRTFEVRVNAVDDAPTKVGNIEDRVSTVANGPITIPASELNAAFDDIDNDNADFIYSATSNDEGVATVTIDGNNNLITTPQGGLGVTTITLNVESEGKASAETETFTITIEKPNRHVDLEDINNGNNLVESNEYTFPPSVLGFDNSYKVEELDAAFHAIRWVDEGLFIHTASVDVRTNVDVVFENDTEAVTLTIPIDNINVEVQNITNIYLHRNITFNYFTGNGSIIGEGIRVIMTQEKVEGEDVRIRPVLSFDNGSNPDATRSYDPIDFNTRGSLTVFEEDIGKQGYGNGGNVEMMATFQVEKKADGVLLGNVLQGIEAIYVADVTHEVSIPDTLTGGMAEVVISHPANVHVEATLLMGVNGGKKVSLEVDQGSTNSTVQFDGTQYPAGQLEVKTNIGPVEDVSTADFSFTVTGIEDISEKFGVEHFPNPVPSGQIVNTTINLPKPGQVTVGIFDTAGRSISSQAVYLSNGEHTLETGTTDLTPGIYFMGVQVEGEGDISMQRIIIAQ